MANRRADTSNIAKKPSKNNATSPDTLIKKTDEKAELSEDELKDVSGGSFSWGISHKDG